MLLLLLLQLVMERKITKENKKKREGNKPQDKQVMCNTIAYHLLTDAQLTPGWQSAPPGQFLTVSTLGMMFCSVEHPFGQFGHLSQRCSSPTSPDSCAVPHFQSMRH